MHNRENISRRCFLELMGVASAGSARFLLWGGPKKAVADAWTERHGQEQKEALRGFIVANAHMGWDDKGQPRVKEQREMMERIISRFPSLDVFVDAGDGFDENCDNEDIQNWSDIIAGGCSTFPFFYTAGKDELGAGEFNINESSSPEVRVNKLGSIQCRPYYSFNIKGIHFVSLPELMAMPYGSKEEMEWLKLDLAVNKEFTTVIISGNPITKLASPSKTKSVNCREVMQILEKNPQIACWVHGDDHSYQIVRLGDRAVVSAGRMGGYAPEKYDHLGGIFFEISENRFDLKAFSASEEVFMEDMEGYENVSFSREKKTSFDKDGEFTVNYGVGGAFNGLINPVWHHHAGSRIKRELYLTGCDSAVLNENSDFSHFYERGNDGESYLPGVSIEKEEKIDGDAGRSWEWMNPGLKLKGSKKVEAGAVYMPGIKVQNKSYYDCVPGKKYKVKINGDFPKKEAKLKFICEVSDSNSIRLIRQESSTFKIKNSGQQIEHIFDIPKLEMKDLIYYDRASDNRLKMTICARFSDFTDDIVLKNFEIKLAGAEGTTVNPGIIFDGQFYSHSGTLKENEYVSFALPSNNDRRSIFNSLAKGNQRFSWLVKERGIDWQIRNAPATVLGDYIEIGKMRNELSGKEEVIIVPARKVNFPYVHRLRHIQGAIISMAKEGKEVISVGVKNVTSNKAEIEIFSERKPEKVVNASKWHYKNGRLTIKVVRRGGIRIEF